MQHRNVRNWPPVWTRDRGQGLKTVRGEVGKLAFIYSNPAVSTRCYLVIDYNGENYVGTLIFDDRAFCKQVTDLLRRYLGKTIQEVGAIELDHTL
ncbi:MAG TPA: hypothetical protein VJQ55_07355 [Candidatus Binatia bacterium]|nr:hypothetical protein [Candidatus Binatia bacterium]